MSKCVEEVNKLLLEDTTGKVLVLDLVWYHEYWNATGGLPHKEGLAVLQDDYAPPSSAHLIPIFVYHRIDEISINNLKDTYSMLVSRIMKIKNKQTGLTSEI